MTGVLAPWGVEVALISWRSVTQNARPPLPAELLASFVVFGGISLLAPSQPQIAGLLGWGIVVATMLNFFPLTPRGDRASTVGEQQTQRPASAGGGPSRMI